MNRIVALALITSAFALTAVADDLAKLEGKWSVKKTMDGQSVTQTFEIKKDTFKFKVIRGSEEVLYGEGKLKLEKAGPLNVVKLVDIKGGVSEYDVAPIEDEYVSVYVLGYNTWTLASNLDKERENQKPSLDAYEKVTK